METDTLVAQALAQTLNFVLVLLVGLLSWAAREAIAWLRARQKKDSFDYLNDLGQRVVLAAEVAVVRNMQTVVDRLKEKSADGKIDKADAKKLLDETTSDVLNYLGTQAVADAEALMNPGKFREFVQAAIEAQVAKWKKGKEQ